MTQEEVMDLLKRYKSERFTINRICFLLNKGRGSISNNCMNLRKWKQVKFEKVKLEGISLKQYVHWV